MAAPVSEFVTTTSLAPADPAGVVQVIDVAETTTTLVQALPPTLTVAPAAKFVPVIVIDVPPAVLPDDGEIEVIVGVEIGVPVITWFPVPLRDTATKRPAPYVTELHKLSAAEVPLFQVIPSGLVITRFPVPSVDTATKRPAPYVTELHELFAAEVRLVQ